jgi:hypothetical protein
MFGFCSYFWKLCSSRTPSNNDKIKALLIEKNTEIDRLNNTIASYKVLLQRKNIQCNELNKKLADYDLLKEDYDKYQIIKQYTIINKKLEGINKDIEPYQIIKNKSNKKQLEEIFNMEYRYIKKFYNELRDKRNKYAH